MPMKPAHALAGAIAASMALAPGLATAAGRANCTVVATPLAFGRYRPQSNYPADFTATVTVTCTSSGGEALPVEGSVSLIGAAIVHRLTDGPQALQYQIYVDPARATPLGDAIGGGVTVTLSGVIGPQGVFRRSIPLYGRLLARQTSARAGEYVDHLVVMLNY